MPIRPAHKHTPCDACSMYRKLRRDAKAEKDRADITKSFNNRKGLQLLEDPGKATT